MSEKPRKSKEERHRESHELMLAVIAGDKAALGRLHELHDHKIRAYAAKILGADHEDDVLEASSAVWTELAENPSIYKADTRDFRAWLCGVAKNRCFRIRDGRRRGEHDAAVFMKAVRREGRPTEAQPDETVETADERDRLAGAIADLSEKDRQVATGLIAGKTYEQISQETGVKTSTLKMRAQRFGAKFMAALRGKKAGVALTFDPLSCDQLFGLTAGGFAGLDSGDLARCLEHAKTCDDCRLHLDGVKAWDDAIEREENDAARSTGNPWPRRLAILGFVGAVTFISAHQITTRVVAPTPTFTPTPLPATPGTDHPEELYLPRQWMSTASSLHMEGKDKEALPWLDKVLAYPKTPNDIRWRAQKLRDEIDKK